MPTPEPAFLQHADGAARTETALALQRSAGNGAVTTLVGPGAYGGAANRRAGRRVAAVGHAVRTAVLDPPKGVATIRERKRDFAFARTQMEVDDQPPLFKVVGDTEVKGGHVAKVARERSGRPDHQVQLPGEGRHEIGRYGSHKQLVEIDRTWAGILKDGEDEHVADTTLAWERTWGTIVAALEAVTKDPPKPAATPEAAAADAWREFSARLPEWLRPKDATESAQRAAWENRTGTVVKRLFDASGRTRDGQGWHTPQKIAIDPATKGDLVERLDKGCSQIGVKKAEELIEDAIRQLKDGVGPGGGPADSDKAERPDPECAGGPG